MSRLNSISEDFSMQSEIDEDIIKTETAKTSQEKYSSKFESDSSQFHRKFIEKKIKYLKRTDNFIPKDCNSRSQLFAEQILKLNSSKLKIGDKFYNKPADPYLVSKLRFENNLHDIKLDSSDSDLKQENFQLLEQYEHVAKAKFISAQYYRLLAKNS